jgi:hypothetical protein
VNRRRGIFTILGSSVLQLPDSRLRQVDVADDDFLCPDYVRGSVVTPFNCCTNLVFMGGHRAAVLLYRRACLCRTSSGPHIVAIEEGRLILTPAFDSTLQISQRVTEFLRAVLEDSFLDLRPRAGSGHLRRIGARGPLHRT